MDAIGLSMVATYAVAVRLTRLTVVYRITRHHSRVAEDIAILDDSGKLSDPWILL